MKRASALIVAMLVSACTRQAIVPPVFVATPPGQERVPGNYAATVQTGGWDLETKTRMLSCGAWTFDTDVNGSYEAAMRDTLTRSLEKVTFTPKIYSPEDLKQNQYDAQIVIHQGNAQSGYTLSHRFFSFSETARAEVTLTVIYAIRDGSGVAYQDTVTGKGVGRKEVYSCPSIGEAVGAGAQDAIRALVRDAVASVRGALRDRPIITMP